MCSGGKCQAQIQNLKDKISQYETKISEAKERYHECLIVNLKKDARLRQLEAPLEKFVDFRNILSNEAIESLQSLNPAPVDDSTFILTALKVLYKDDLSRVKTKTYSGRGHMKEKISPKKIEVLKKLFTERLECIQTNTNGQNANFGKHVKTAIESINKMSSRNA